MNPEPYIERAFDVSVALGVLLIAAAALVYALSVLYKRQNKMFDKILEISKEQVQTNERLANALEKHEHLTVKVVELISKVEATLPR
ncbi:MAG: hypothetical protein HRU12_03795 [Phaeodactylibacter sp.]|nr:hypothetical protein [Phaeodactylibacter sp.]